MVDAVPDLGPDARVMNVDNGGTACLVPHLRARGVQDILAVDPSPEALEQV